MSNVTITMTPLQLVELTSGDFKNVKELRNFILDLLRGESDPPKRSPGVPVKLGRPLTAKHPHLDAEALLHWRDVLFSRYAVGISDEWRHPETKARPARLAKDQSDMEPDEIRLDNGVIAVLPAMEDLPPMPAVR